MSAWKKLQRNLKIFRTLKQEIRAWKLSISFIKEAYIEKIYLEKYINEPRRRRALKTKLLSATKL